MKAVTYVAAFLGIKKGLAHIIYQRKLRRLKMNKSKYRVYNGKKVKSVFENSKIILLFFQLIAGMLFGAFVSGKNNEALKGIADAYIRLRNAGFISDFINSFAVNGAFIIISVFLGFSLIGCPLIYLLMFFRGLGIGSFCGYMYLKYKLTGIGYSLLTVYPSLIIAVFALIMSCRNSGEYSMNAYEKAVKGRGQFEKDETKIFIFRQAVFLAITALSSLIDAVFALAFSSFFTV